MRTITFYNPLYATIVGTALILIAACLVPTHKAEAQTISQLQAIIDQLLEQVEELQSRISDMESSGESGTQSNGIGSCVSSFNRNLTIGDRGSDVRALQQLLNSDPETRLDGTYGVSGNETDYFGPTTADAVVRFQEKYRSDILAPEGLANGSGFFGASTRAHLRQEVCGQMAHISYSLRDVESVTVAYSASDFDGDPDRYTIELDNGVTHVVYVAGNAPRATFTTALRNTGYTGDIDALLAMAEEDEDADPITSGTYQGRLDVTRVSSNRMTVIAQGWIQRKATSGIGEPCGPINLGQIVWGDGEETFVRGQGCNSNQQAYIFVHTYEESGEYDIVLESINGETLDEQTVAARVGSYTIEDVRSVTSRYVDPSSRAVDDEYTEYKITLRNGAVHTVRAYGNAPQSTFYDAIRDTGYTGGISTLLNRAEELDEEEDGSYDLSDVESVTIEYSSSAFDGDTNRYTIELEDGTEHVVNVAGNAPASTLTTAIRNTGYTGDIDDLLAMAGEDEEEKEETSSYGLSDVESVTIEYSSSNFDGDTNRYTIELENGTTHVLNVAGNAPASTLTTAIRNTGYTGDIDALLAMADGSDNGDDSYGLTDVKSVTTREVNTSDSNADGGYIEYTITLKDGTVHKVNRSSGPMTAGMIESLFRATGYTGDINALVSMAS